MDELPDDALFFVDSEGGTAAGGGVAVLAPQTKKEKARAKVLRVDSILTKQAPSKAYPIPVPRGVKGPPTASFATKGNEALAEHKNSDKAGTLIKHTHSPPRPRPRHASPSLESWVPLNRMTRRTASAGAL